MANPAPEHPDVPIAPGRRPLVGHLPALLRDPMSFLQGVRGAGDLVRIHAGPTQLYVVNSPELLHQLLVSDAKSYYKGKIFDRAKVAFGEGLLTSEGDFHLRQRRMVQPAFRTSSFDRWVDVMVGAAQSRVDAWRAGEPVDFLRDMNELTLSVTIDTLMRSELTPEAREQVLRSTPIVIHGLITQLMYPSWLPAWVPLPGNRRFHRGSRELRGVFEHLLRSYRADNADGDDLFSLMCNANDEETNYRMTDEQVQNEAISFLLASTETTATALAWICYRLAQDPQMQQRVRDEVRSVVGDGELRWEHVKKLTYTDQVISEGLRLYSPTWMVMRRAVADTRLGPYAVPRDTELVFSPTTLHRDPALYEDPLAFKPERWDNVRPSSLKEAYMPFGFGRRKCIGDGFARLEMLAALVTFTRQLHLELPEGVQVTETKFVANLQPKGLKLRTRALARV
ncbi:cytochrome P450 [Crossiella equi]|uniref:Cytochrome P450 n=1 Tax=Crossiella equi TaxID=130796 RepID=A0ABS5A6H5_9PSEU|nr:cytochrome P450 [Crossiella equi]MBP2472192.1 cytochrome P450 [Crossiella equi]